MYDPAKVSLAVNGVPVIGFAKGSFVEAGYNTPLTEMEAGAQGFMNTALSRDESGKIKFTLMNASPSNQYMEYLVQLNKQGVPWTTVFLGPNGGYTGATCYVGERAKLGYSEKPDDNREWEINIEVMEPTPDPAGVLANISAALGINLG